MINKIPVITIDGPSSAGKSTLCKIIAQKLNWFPLESGKIYRSLALFILKNNIHILEKNIIPIAKNLDCLTHKANDYIKNINYTSNTIDFQMISEVSSQIATYPNIRKILLNKQKLMRRLPGLVAEGRDMGTAVFPDAIIKFFLNATLLTRVERRMLELKKNGCKISFKELLMQMKKRDTRDQNRLISPLYISKNAIILDSTHMTFPEVVRISMKHIIKKIKI